MLVGSSLQLNKIIFSNQDRSFNVISPYENGNVESRFVQRIDDYFIIYLSSHNGCNQSCRMCFLTQQGKTSMVDVDMGNYIEQTKKVIDKIDRSNIINSKKCHINFMAMGDALLNETILEKTSELIDNITQLLYDNNIRLETKFNISTIIPDKFNGNLSDIFERENARMYYSLYSIDESFRKKWLPKAMNPFKALDKIKEMQLINDKEIIIHNSFIRDQNDSDESVEKMFNALKERDIKFRFNLVRYNSFDLSKFQETSEERLGQILKYVNDLNDNNSSKIVSRVGFDVAASCGMFIK